MLCEFQNRLICPGLSASLGGMSRPAGEAGRPRATGVFRPRQRLTGDAQQDRWASVAWPTLGGPVAAGAAIPNFRKEEQHEHA